MRPYCGGEGTEVRSCQLEKTRGLDGNTVHTEPFQSLQPKTRQHFHPSRWPQADRRDYVPTLRAALKPEDVTTSPLPRRIAATGVPHPSIVPGNSLGERVRGLKTLVPGLPTSKPGPTQHGPVQWLANIQLHSSLPGNANYSTTCPNSRSNSRVKIPVSWPSLKWIA